MADADGLVGKGGGEVLPPALTPEVVEVSGTNEKPIKPPKAVVIVSYEDVTKKHELSQADVDKLAAGSSSHYFDVFLSSAFAAGASIIQGVERLVTVTTPKTPPTGVTVLDLLIIVTPIVALIVAVIFFVLWKGEKNETASFLVALGKRPTRPAK